MLYVKDGVVSSYIIFKYNVMVNVDRRRKLTSNLVKNQPTYI